MQTFVIILTLLVLSNLLFFIVLLLLRQEIECLKSEMLELITKKKLHTPTSWEAKHLPTYLTQRTASGHIKGNTRKSKEP